MRSATAGMLRLCARRDRLISRLGNEEAPGLDREGRARIAERNKGIHRSLARIRDGIAAIRWSTIQPGPR